MVYYGHVGFVRLGQDLGGLHQQNSMMNSKGWLLGYKGTTPPTSRPGCHVEHNQTHGVTFTAHDMRFAHRNQRGCGLKKQTISHKVKIEPAPFEKYARKHRFMLTN